jgi:hypothetical protein
MLIEGGAFVYAEDPAAELWHTGDPDVDGGNEYAQKIYRTPKAAAKAAKAAKTSSSSSSSSSSTPLLLVLAAAAAAAPVGTKRKADEQLQSAGVKGGVVDLIGDDED